MNYSEIMHTGMRGKRSFPFGIDGIMSAIIHPLCAERQKRGGLQRELSKVPFGDNPSTAICLPPLGMSCNRLHNHYNM